MNDIKERNSATGNLVDTVSKAYAAYAARERGSGRQPLASWEWHTAKRFKVPKHDPCNLCSGSWLPVVR